MEKEIYGEVNMFGWSLRQKTKNIAMRIPGVERSLSLARPRARVFQKAYATRAWGSAESGSGIGSELAATENLSAYLPELFQRLEVSRFLDAPCGDWNWMRRVDLSGVHYVGADVVFDVVAQNTRQYARTGVQFIHADLTKDDLPKADMILCRDCWVHLSFQDIAAILKNFRRTGATWLLVSHTPSQDRNQNKLTGIGWRHLNLHLPPFSFPPKIESRKDHYPDVPFEIALWRLADLPEVKL
jgi:SAM-dependent methyltransferase